MAICRLRAESHDVRKVFIDGIPQKPVFPVWYIVVDYRKTEDESLDIINTWASDCEENDLADLAMTNAPYDAHIGQRVRRTAEYFPTYNPTSIVLADSDGESGMDKPANSLDTRQRTQIILDALCNILPTTIGCRVRLSNKAFLHKYNENYADKLAHHMFIQLTEPQPHEIIKEAFLPWHGTTDIDQLDTNTMNYNSVFYLGRPKLFRTTPEGKRQKINLKLPCERGYLRKGTKLDLNTIFDTEEYKERKKQTDQLDKQISTNIDYSDAAQTICEIAATGYYEGIRWKEHYKLIAQSIWVYRDADPIIYLILSEPDIIGNERGIKDLDAEAAKIHRRNRKKFGCRSHSGADIKSDPLWNQDFAWRDAIEEIDLEHWDGTKLLNFLKGRNYKANILCKSAHGTSKTNGFQKKIRADMQKNIGRPLRELYICNRRSNVSGAARNLELTCYLKEDGKTIRQFLCNEDNLAICLHSLKRLLDDEYNLIAFDIVWIDESESVSLDAAWKNDNHNYLKEICEKSSLIVMLDADLGDLSHSLAREISEKNGNKLAALFNNASHIKGKTFQILDSEIDGYSMVDRLLAQKKRVYMHLDIADQITDKRLSSIAEYFNDRYGEGTALAIDSELARKKKYRGILSDPDTHLKDLMDDGIRLFIVSPVIETGWRYGGTKNFTGKYFDATVGIYKLARHTAPIILQATQRCVGVKEHYLAVPRNCVYQSGDDYEAQMIQALVEEHEATERVIDARKVKADLHYADRVQIEAQKKKDLQLSNVMLHLIYLLQDYGAIIDFLEPLELSQDEMAIKGLVKDIAEINFHNEAAGLFEDYTERQRLAQYFGIEDIEEYEKCLELIKRRNKIAKLSADIHELLWVATSTEEERRSWGRFPYWQTKNEASLSVPHYAQYGYVIDAMVKGVKDCTGTDIFSELLTGKKHTIAIDTTDFRTQKLLADIRKHEALLKPKTEIFKTKGSETTYLRRMLSDLLDLDVKGEAKAKGLVAAKERIIRHYMEKGHILKTKHLKTNTNIKIVHRIIRQRIATGSELTAEEEDFLDHTDKIITVSLKDEQSEAIRHRLALINAMQLLRTGEEIEDQKNKKI